MLTWRYRDGEKPERVGRREDYTGRERAGARDRKREVGQRENER